MGFGLCKLGCVCNSAYAAARRARSCSERRRSPSAVARLNSLHNRPLHVSVPIYLSQKAVRAQALVYAAYDCQRSSFISSAKSQTALHVKAVGRGDEAICAAEKTPNASISTASSERCCCLIRSIVLPSANTAEPLTEGPTRTFNSVSGASRQLSLNDAKRALSKRN